jgi:hypothetical protein
MTKTYMALDPNNVNASLIGIEAHRDLIGQWVIDKAFRCGPEPRASVDLTSEILPRVYDFLETQEGVNARNAEASKQEVAEFKAQTSDKWFGYFNAANRAVQTWTGDKLADVTWTGPIYRTPCFGGFSKRFNFRAKGVDGRGWAGTAYASSGDYVRMRVVTGKSKS